MVRRELILFCNNGKEGIIFQVRKIQTGVIRNCRKEMLPEQPPGAVNVCATLCGIASGHQALIQRQQQRQQHQQQHSSSSQS